MKTPSILLAWAAVVLGAPAAAEMYRCKGPDGHTLYTSDASQCPGAEAHEPTGRVQSVPSGAIAPPHYARDDEAAAALDGHEEARAAAWRNRKEMARSNLERVSRRLQYVQRGVKWCNRGHDLYVENEDGIRKSYSCNQVKAEAEQLAAERQQLEAYLHQGGLQEECRRAGCLPGWIRD